MTHDDFWSRTNAVRWSDSKPLQDDETYQIDKSGNKHDELCWTCGNSYIEAIEKVALAIQQRHDDGSSFEREWTNHHGLMRCDCDELIEFIRGRDKTFWYGI